MTESGQSSFEIDGSTIGYLENIDPAKNLAMLAVWHLTEAPVEIRRRFLDEFTGYVSVAAFIDESEARKRVIDRMGFMCAGQGSGETVRRITAAWKEAEVTVSNLTDIHGKSGIWKNGKLVAELPDHSPDHTNPN